MEILYGSPCGYFILISFKISQKSHHANVTTTYEYIIVYSKCFGYGLSNSRSLKTYD
jgi:hypothetical protein